MPEAIGVGSEQPPTVISLEPQQKAIAIGPTVRRTLAETAGPVSHFPPQ